MRIWMQVLRERMEGWKRNLRVEEIVEQVLAVERWKG